MSSVVAGLAMGTTLARLKCVRVETVDGLANAFKSVDDLILDFRPGQHG